MQVLIGPSTTGFGEKTKILDHEWTVETDKCNITA